MKMVLKKVGSLFVCLILVLTTMFSTVFNSNTDVSAAVVTVEITKAETVVQGRDFIDVTLDKEVLPSAMTGFTIGNTPFELVSGSAAASKGVATLADVAPIGCSSGFVVSEDQSVKTKYYKLMIDTSQPILNGDTVLKWRSGIVSTVIKAGTKTATAKIAYNAEVISSLQTVEINDTVGHIKLTFSEPISNLASSHITLNNLYGNTVVAGQPVPADGIYPNTNWVVPITVKEHAGSLEGNIKWVSRASQTDPFATTTPAIGVNFNINTNTLEGYKIVRNGEEVIEVEGVQTISGTVDPIKLAQKVVSLEIDKVTQFGGVNSVKGSAAVPKKGTTKAKAAVPTVLGADTTGIAITFKGNVSGQSIFSEDIGVNLADLQLSDITFDYAAGKPETNGNLVDHANELLTNEALFTALVIHPTDPTTVILTVNPNKIKQSSITVKVNPFSFFNTDAGKATKAVAISRTLDATIGTVTVSPAITTANRKKDDTKYLEVTFIDTTTIPLTISKPENFSFVIEPNASANLPAGGATIVSTAATATNKFRVALDRPIYGNISLSAVYGTVPRTTVYAKPVEINQDTQVTFTVTTDGISDKVDTKNMVLTFEENGAIAGISAEAKTELLSTLKTQLETTNRNVVVNTVEDISEAQGNPVGSQFKVTFTEIYTAGSISVVLPSAVVTTIKNGGKEVGVSTRNANVYTRQRVDFTIDQVGGMKNSANTETIRFVFTKPVSVAEVQGSGYGFTGLMNLSTSKLSLSAGLGSSVYPVGSIVPVEVYDPASQSYVTVDGALIFALDVKNYINYKYVDEAGRTDLKFALADKTGQPNDFADFGVSVDTTTERAVSVFTKQIVKYNVVASTSRPTDYVDIEFFAINTETAIFDVPVDISRFEYISIVQTDPTIAQLDTTPEGRAKQRVGVYRVELATTNDGTINIKIPDFGNYDFDFDPTFFTSVDTGKTVNVYKEVIDATIALGSLASSSITNSNYTYDGGTKVLTLGTANKTLQFTGSTQVARVVVNATGVKMILSGNISSTENVPITINANQSATLSGTGQMIAGLNSSGIEVKAGAVLTINGTGILSFRGNGEGAGIDVGNNDGSGTVNIVRGTVSANGGYNGAGIGSGANESYSGNINISGRNTIVNAQGGSYGAGIGTGYQAHNSTINISGGKVYAQSSGTVGIGAGFSAMNVAININGGIISAIGNGADIGGDSVSPMNIENIHVVMDGGYIANENIIISPTLVNSDGVELFRNIIKIKDVDTANVRVYGEVEDVNYNFADVYTDSEGQFYPYLPKTNVAKTITVTALGKESVVKYVRTENNEVKETSYPFTYTVVADGTAGSVDTTALMITLSTPINNLAASNITIAPGSGVAGAAVKGALTKITDPVILGELQEGMLYRLAVSGVVGTTLKQGTIKVVISGVDGYVSPESGETAQISTRTIIVPTIVQVGGAAKKKNTTSLKITFKTASGDVYDMSAMPLALANFKNGSTKVIAKYSKVTAVPVTGTYTITIALYAKLKAKSTSTAKLTLVQPTNAPYIIKTTALSVKVFKK